MATVTVESHSFLLNEVLLSWGRADGLALGPVGSGAERILGHI